MPLHLNSITNDPHNNGLLAWIFSYGLHGVHSMYVTEDKKYVHSRYHITNNLTDDLVGHIVYTIAKREKNFELLDVDIVWKSDAGVSLQFDAIRDGSSESNEYYDAEIAEGVGHLEIETVNRHVINEDLVNAKREVYASAFPFELSVFENIDAFNKWAGYKNPVKVGSTDIEVHGFSKTFIMPGGADAPNRPKGEYYSFALGEVVSYQDVEVAFGEFVLTFVLAKVNTALGVIPVAMSREVFDLENLKVGCIVAMKADIKADLATEEDFKAIS